MLLWIPDSKTEAGKRCIEVPAVLRPFLLKLADGKKPEQHIFGTHWRDWPRKWVKKICAEAKVPLVTAHGMRGLHATLAVQAGTSAHIVAATMGHASPKVTEQHYTARSATAAAKQRRMLEVIEGGAGACQPDNSRPPELGGVCSTDSKNISATGGG